MEGRDERRKTVQNRKDALRRKDRRIEREIL